MTDFIGGGSGAPAPTSHPDLVGRTSSLDPLVMLFGLLVLIWLCYQCWRAERPTGRN